MALAALAFVVFADVAPKPTPAVDAQSDFLLKFSPESSEAQRRAISADMDVLQVHGLLCRVRLPQGTQQHYATDHPAIEYLEPNVRYSAQRVPNDPEYPAQWGLSNNGQTGGTPGADISAELAWSVMTASDDVVVAILDSGMDIAHEDLAANLFTNPGEIPDNGLDDDGNGFVDDVHGWDFIGVDAEVDDPSGHGSHVAGIIGAVGDNGLGVTGLNWRTKLLPVKFLNSGGIGDTFQAIQAIDYAIAMGADIINASWGGREPSLALRDAIARANAAGIPFVTAAGNANPAQNLDEVPFYPASYDLPGIISVAAVDHNDEGWMFSNFGPVGVDIAAPGVSILSSQPGNQYGLRNGTSMSTAYASGVMALIRQRFPQLGLAEAKAQLLDHADTITQLGGFSAEGRRLNAFRPIADDDELEPAQIVDLSVVDPESSRLDLTWTATGDDGEVGTAHRYEIRYAQQPLDASNFDTGTAVPGLPRPAPAGSREQIRVRGLQANTRYYFAAIVRDELGNTSPISNVASGVTLDLPSVTLSPTAISVGLDTGAQATRSVRLENQGTGEYLFRVVSKRRLFDGSTNLAPVISPQSALNPTQPLAPAGSDNTGSQLRVLIVQSASDVTPVRQVLEQFEGIGRVDVFDARVATVTPEMLEDYNVVIAVANVAYFNTEALGDVLADFVDKRRGIVLTLASFMAAFDLAGRFGDEGMSPFFPGIDVISSASLGVFDPDHPLMAGVTSLSGQRIGDIRLRSHATQIAAWEGGYPLVAATDGTVVGLNIFIGGTTLWAGDMPQLLGNAVLWAGNVADWIAPEQQVGVVAGGAAMDISLTIDAAGLVDGQYDSHIVVEGTAPGHPTVSIPIRLDVEGEPQIQIPPQTIDFGTTLLGDPVSRTISVSNIGFDTLTVGAISVDDPQFSVGASNFELEPGASRDVAVTFQPSAVGNFTAELSISSSDPDRPQASIALIGEGVAAPVIAVSTNSIEATLPFGATTTQTVSVSNLGGTALQLRAFLDIPESSDALSGSGSQTFAADFESGSLEPWQLRPSSALREITDVTAAASTTRSYHETEGGVGHFDGIFGELGGIRPGYVGFWVRSGSTTTNDAYVTLGDTQNRAIIFLAASDGKFHVNPDRDGDNSVAYQAESWHHIEFKEIDWSAWRFDYFVDGELIRADLSFRNPQLVDNFAVVDLYNFNTGSEAWWDEVFISSAAPPAWASLSTTAQTLAPGATLDLHIALDAERVFGGSYEARLVLRSNDPATAELVVPIRLDIQGTPELAVTSNGLDFGDVYLGQERRLSFELANLGTGPLSVTAIETTSSEFSAAPQQLSVAAKQRAEISVTYRPSVEGSSQAELLITSDDPAAGVTAVSLEGRSTRPPQAQVETSQISQLQPVGVIETRTLMLHNPGSEPLEYSLSLTDAQGSPISTQGTAFADDSESGSVAWESVALGSDDLWHRTQRDARSPRTSYWCGDEQTGHYGTSSAVSNYLLSPPLDLRGLEPPIRLSFWEKYVTEPGFDQCMVDLSLDDGMSWIPLRGGYGEAPSGDSGGWVFSALDLSAYVDQQIRVRYYFETQDSANNALPGWFVDDIRLSARTAPWVSVASSQGSVAPGAETALTLTFDTVELVPPGEYNAVLEVRSNDVFAPSQRIAIDLTVVDPEAPAVAVATPTALVAALPPRSRHIATEVVGLSNNGGQDLTWHAMFDGAGLDALEPSEGTLAAGSTQSIAIDLSAAELDEGDYTSTLVLLTNDPDRERIEIPLMLHVREVELEYFHIDVTPKFAVTDDTVETVLQLPMPYRPQEVVMGTVELAGQHAYSAPILIRDVNADGLLELVLQFNREEFTNALPVVDRGVYPATIVGEVEDRVWFKGTAYLRGVAIIE